MSEPVIFITKMVAKEGKRDLLLASGERMLEQTAKEDGVLIYNFHVSADNPNEFWYYDMYRDQAAFEAHCNSAPYKKMLQEVGDLIAEVLAVPVKSFGLVGECMRQVSMNIEKH